MTFFDQALVFPCAGETLVGVASIPATPLALGMVVVVGGPQYRAGSHRQFVLLARRAAAAGIATLRFDYRGMGDSNGPPIGFENVDEDIRCAIDALVSRCPAVKKVVLWGLCDGASAALIYVQRSRDARVAGVCILNPWVRTASSLARTHIKHYYGQRLMDRQFWTKLMTGGVKITGAFRELISKFRVSTTRSGAKSVAIPYQSRMAVVMFDVCPG